MRPTPTLLLLAALGSAETAQHRDDGPSSGMGEGWLGALSRLPLESQFSFELGGRGSSSFLGSWNRTSRTYPVRSGAGVGGNRTRTVFFQPQPCQGWECPTAPGNGLPAGATDVGCSARGGAGCSWFGLQVIAVKTSYGSVRGATAATEWSLAVRSTAPVAESLPLCAVRTLNATLALPVASNLTIDFRDACAIVSPSHPAPPGSGRQPGDGPAPNPICANGPVQLPARLLTTRPLECSGAGGCQPNQFHPQLASFPPGASFTLGEGQNNSNSLGNDGNPSGPNGGLPFFGAWTTAAAGSGARQSFSGITASVGWTGHWTGQLSRTATGLQVSAGQADFCYSLKPGEAFKFPSVLVVEWSGDSPQVGTNAHRRIVTDYKIPRDPDNNVLGMVTNGNGMQGPSTWKKFDLESQLFHLHALQQTHVEGLWLDASWFGKGFGPSGDWHLPASAVENSDAFPGGLGVLGQAAHSPQPGQNATKFIVWFEPERVTSGSYIYEHFPSQTVGMDIDVGGGVLTDLGNEAMREYIVEYINAAIDEYQLDVLRLDFNIQALPAWRARDAISCPPP